MANQPTNPPPQSPSAAPQTTGSGDSKLLPPDPVPRPATYIVQLPREQILRHPPPENAKRMAALTRREDRRRRSCCRRCCCLVLCLIAVLVVLAAVSAVSLYLVFDFKSPKYAVTAVSVRGVNLTSPAPISPRIAVSIRAENSNSKVGIYCLRDSAAGVYYGGVELSNGALPQFYQPRKNVTVVRAPLAWSGVELRGAVVTALRNAQRRRTVPLVVRVEAPVRFKVGSANTWEMMIELKCDVVLDSFTLRAEVLSQKCDHSVRLY
ncbi:Late embryogenesis abundant (LEA) hydroxyproline-rich glycoprotein family [Striga hermonthica]|uniref:Late embryogenesis abundant (LEA) hydroxyproline-rich glycoprotein family n=1 Tax=Striga hermonthica TaxID=68872 RepID=A0A9N7N8J0_STRHE|nr:Late embryogenesis abundant (LEA) hydroxyproline-rich glycoprotein family [Striga hermonthica]